MTGGPAGHEDVERWHEDGWCVLENLFAPSEVAEAIDELAGLYPTAADVAAGEVDGFDPGWNTVKPRFPFDGPALNRLLVHDALIDLAGQLLDTDRVRLYQGIVSAKYTGNHDEYEQLLHADYGNHTLVVPRDEPGYQQLLLFIYLSDVTPDRAATRIVSRRLTRHIPVERTYLSFAEYGDLYAAEVPANGPAGSVLAYRPDVYHRGIALVEPASSRFILHGAYTPAGTEWIGFHSWPVRGEDMAWHRFVAGASERQLTVLGFPEPGHPYWTPETLDGVGARYPSLDMTPWRDALGVSGGG